MIILTCAHSQIHIFYFYFIYLFIYFFLGGGGLYFQRPDCVYKRSNNIYTNRTTGILGTLMVKS